MQQPTSGRAYPEVDKSILHRSLEQSPSKIDIEPVLELSSQLRVDDGGILSEWPRLDLGQIDVPQGEHRQAVEEQPGLFWECEDHGGLVASSRILGEPDHVPARVQPPSVPQYRRSASVTP